MCGELKYSTSMMNLYEKVKYITGKNELSTWEKENYIKRFSMHFLVPYKGNVGGILYLNKEIRL